MILHRIILAKYGQTPDDVFGGRGAAIVTGRWHTRGELITYTAESISLAMAEALVHLQRTENVAPYCRWTIDVPDSAIAAEPKLPAHWIKSEETTRAIGDGWLAARSFVGLRVPSALVPEEFNVLLNPAHPEFSYNWITAGPIPFSFDPRLTAS